MTATLQNREERERKIEPDDRIAVDGGVRMRAAMVESPSHKSSRRLTRRL